MVPMKYSDERKEAVLKKLLPAHNCTVAQLAEEKGILTATLYKWRKQARSRDRLLSEAGARRTRIHSQRLESSSELVGYAGSGLAIVGFLVALTLLRWANCGAQAARSAGFEAARAEFITLTAANLPRGEA